MDNEYNKYFDPAKSEEEKIEKFNKALLVHQKEGISILDGNINDYIAAITTIARYNPELEDMNRDTENEITILSYLRDNEKYKAKTGREAFDFIAKSKVDQKVVELWIEEGMTDSPNIANAIKLGYPKLLEKIEENK